jgi:nicotinamide-nucleotide amidase
MRGLLLEEVLPRLVARQRGEGVRVVRSRTLRTTGVPESAIAERVGAVEDEIAPLTLAYLPSEAGVDLRLTAWALAPEDAERRLGDALALVRGKLDEHCYGEDDTDLAGQVLAALRGAKHTLAVAESCTGGVLGARITAIPGASDTFVGGLVAYADRIKHTGLGVPAEILETHGAVSEPTVIAMAEGARRVFGADCAIAVTGIAGPGGGTPEKPVGTVWLGAATPAGTRAVKRVFPGDRDEIRQRSAQAGLDLLRRLLLRSV